MSTAAIVERVASVDELRQAILARKHQSPAWAAKMLHPVPDLPTVGDRARYLVEKARGRVVLDVGCTGPISAAIREAAATYYGVDAAPGSHVMVDLDRHPEALPVYADVDLVIASELLEHLMNPGRFLDALKAAYPGRVLYLTVPQAGGYQVQGDCEVVNGDHVAWYSYTTLGTLLRRVGITVDDWRWYHGQPHKAEGLIAVARL